MEEIGTFCVFNDITCTLYRSVVLRCLNVMFYKLILRYKKKRKKKKKKKMFLKKKDEIQNQCSCKVVVCKEVFPDFKNVL